MFESEAETGTSMERALIRNVFDLATVTATSAKMTTEPVHTRWRTPTAWKVPDNTVITAAAARVAENWYGELVHVCRWQLSLRRPRGKQQLMMIAASSAGIRLR
jgi:hypothetical protein